MRAAWPITATRGVGELVVARAPRWVLAGVGVVIGVVGAWLATRPVTTITLLGPVLGLGGLVACSAGLIGGPGRSRPGPVEVTASVALGVGGATLVAWGPQVVGGVVWGLCAWWVLRGGVGVVTGGRYGDWVGRLAGLARLVLGVLGWLRVDVALVAISTIVCGLAVAWGARLVTRAVRGRAMTWRPVLRWSGTVAGALVAAVLGAVAVTGTDAVVIGDFYDGPTPLDDEPGTLLATEPYDGEVGDGLRALRLLYVTRDEFDTPVPASAVVAIPVDAADPVPLISWGHGTVGVTRPCAPSLGPDVITPDNLPLADRLTDRGWAVVATDYPGQGTEAAFPYLIGEGQGRAILDAARAARQVPDVVWADEVVVLGHSQGGHAALWAGHIAGIYAPDLTVVGTAGLSPAADPLALARVVVDRTEAPGATLAIGYVADAYSRYYPQLALADLVTPPGEVLVHAGAARCVGDRATLSTVLVGLAVGGDRPIARADALDGPFGTALGENEATGPWSAPAWVAHGTADEVIPYHLTEDWVARRCLQGQPVAFTSLPDATHMGVLEPGEPLRAQLETWTDERFRGVADAGAC